MNNELKYRQVFETQIREHMLGPGLAKEIFCCNEDASDEILDGDPKVLYSTGVLYPLISDNDGDPDADDQQNDDEAEESTITNDENADNGDEERELVDEEENENNEEGEKEQLESDGGRETPTDRDRTAHSGYIGLITCVDPKCEEVKISIKYAKYHRLKGDEKKKVKLKLGFNYDRLRDLLDQYDAVEGNDKAETYLSIDDDNKCISLSRTDYTPESPRIKGDLNEFNYIFKKLFKPSFYQREEIKYECTIKLNAKISNIDTDDLSIICKCYRKNRGNGIKKYLKVLVRNKQNCHGQTLENGVTEKCLFQLCARITPVGHHLVTYTDPVNYVFDTENNETEYMYRFAPNLGKGVGCAVNWDVNGEWIETAYIPSSEVKKYSNSLDKEYCESLGIEEHTIKDACNLFNLSHWNKEDENYINHLNEFVSGYEKWVERQKVDAAKEPQFEEVYKSILKKQETLLNRLKDNVLYLSQNPTALECFQLANTAMLIQMTIARNPLFRKNRDVAEIKEDSSVFNNLDWFKENGKETSYYPFQLAFLLMNVKSTFEEDDEFRNKYVDLIWFPTGGGKTEAYLALTALTIIARRKTAHSDIEANGVSVIMRYTLRLLTTQQFERASYLICALEFMRNQKPNIDLGFGGPITIGRWIGQGGENARKSFISGLETGNKARTNPYPITYCPWCGSKLVRDELQHNVYRHGYINDGDTQCLNGNCHFKSLPIQYVDKELYRTPPTLLLATVDKFANLTKKEAAKMLGYGTNAKSPDLIIQDELHLISGPLGSMVGFFEMIVEKLASKNNHHPKVIASTATTRNTGDQIEKLYNKEVNVFPAQGISFNDNFFSHVEKTSLRRHIGILPQAYPVMAEVRIIAQLILAKVALLKTFLEDKGIDVTDSTKISELLRDDDGYLAKEIDPYWTLVLYYNSLKDLGRTRSRISQDIMENLRVQKRYLQIPPGFDFIWSGIDHRVQEFTSRMDSSQIKDMLTKAESQAQLFMDDNQKLHERGSNIDLVLASNMISVGIDVARWNVMLISGQPRSNSEYIQSSSRVARKNMGLVINTYSPQRIREVSLYENFTSYHEAYYKFVEPLSLTPVTMQLLKNAILNNVRKCYQDYIHPGSEQETVLDSLINEMKERFHLDDEMTSFAKNEVNARWNESDTVSSLRVVDPNCWTQIKEINYN